MSSDHDRYSAEQKAAVVRRHLIENQPITDLAAELGAPASQIDAWVQMALAAGDQAFGRPTRPVASAWRWSRGNPVAAALAATAFLLLLALAIGGPVAALREKGSHEATANREASASREGFS